MRKQNFHPVRIVAAAALALCLALPLSGCCWEEWYGTGGGEYLPPISGGSTNGSTGGTGGGSTSGGSGSSGSGEDTGLLPGWATGTSLVLTGRVTESNWAQMKTFINNNKIEILNLNNVTGLDEIPDNALQGCTSLEKVYLPSSVTEIKDSAFKGCTNLDYITTLSQLTTIGAHAFEGTALTTVVLTQGNLTSIGEDAFAGCKKLSQIDLTRCTGLTTIEKGAFKNCTGLKQAALPANLVTVENNAFNGCTSLDKLTFSTATNKNSQLEKIGASAFEGCTGLTEITLPYPKAGAYCVIDQNAFATSGNTPLTITIPAGTGNFTFQAGSKAFEKRTVTLNYSGSDKADIVAKLEAAGATVTNK